MMNPFTYIEQAIGGGSYDPTFVFMVALIGGLLSTST